MVQLKVIFDINSNKILSLLMPLFTALSLLTLGVVGFDKAATTKDLPVKMRTKARVQGVVCLLFGILALLWYWKDSNF